MRISHMIDIAYYSLWVMLYLIFAVIPVSAILFNRARIRDKRKRFSSRSVLSVDQIYADYFSKTGFPQDLVIELWLDLAKTLKLEAGRLRPDDRFDKELAPSTKVGGFVDELEDLHLRHQKRLRKFGIRPPEDWFWNLSLGEYITTMCAWLSAATVPHTAK